ncbi:MAG: hypothetical protein U9O64_01485 [Campylobacterota bacterium]|nr:hypothetical protein [Campylobacterota bacterium]
MEHYVIIDKLCSCAKREGLEKVVSFDTKENAKDAADVKLLLFNEGFCGKHNFDITEVNHHYVIGMLEGGCGCGSSEGGCGTHEKH